MSEQVVCKQIELFIDLVVDLINTHDIYSNLYENAKSQQLMELTAKRFFYDLNNILIDYLIISFARITDPATSWDNKEKKRVNNLTVDYIVSLFEEEDKQELLDYVAKMKNFRDDIIDARNKAVAHIDLATHVNNKLLGEFTQGKDREFLKALWEFCNCVSVKKNHKFLGGINVRTGGDVLDLIHAMQQADAFERLTNDATTSEEVVKYAQYLRSDDRG